MSDKTLKQLLAEQVALEAEAAALRDAIKIAKDGKKGEATILIREIEKEIEAQMKKLDEIADEYGTRPEVSIRGTYYNNWSGEMRSEYWNDSNC